MDTTSLDIHSQGLELKAGSFPFSVSYRVCFKLMHTNLSSKSLSVSPKGYTMLLKVNLERSSMTVPRTLQRHELTQNPIWRLQGMTTSIKRQNTATSIIEYPDGNVEARFNSEPRYPRIQKIMSRCPSTSSDTRTVALSRETFWISESMRTMVDLVKTSPMFNMKEKVDLYLQPQSDMEWRSEPIYNQINVLTLNSTEKIHEEKYRRYIDLYISLKRKAKRVCDKKRISFRPSKIEKKLA